MEVMLTGEVSDQVISMAKTNRRFAGMMARQLLEAVDRDRLASYLLSDRHALQLLVEKLQKRPEATLADLHRISAGGSSHKGRSRG
jgi:hypothetical protein